MYDSGMVVGIASTGLMEKGIALMGGRMVNHGTSANESSHVESSWHLSELTEGAVTIEVQSLFQI